MNHWVLRGLKSSGSSFKELVEAFQLLNFPALLFLVVNIVIVAIAGKGFGFFSNFISAVVLTLLACFISLIFAEGGFKLWQRIALGNLCMYGLVGLYVSVLN
jgi:amino acid permease